LLGACPPLDPGGDEDRPAAAGERCNFSVAGDGCDGESSCLNGTCHKVCGSNADCGGGTCAMWERTFGNSRLQACQERSGRGPATGNGGGAGGLGATCRTLLASADPAHFRSCGMAGVGAQPPRLPAELPCIRDTYVAAAVQYCWAASVMPSWATRARPPRARATPKNSCATLTAFVALPPRCWAAPARPSPPTVVADASGQRHQGFP
jgi:hypothetical protein